MTTDDQRIETNQDIFDDYVRHVLKDAGVDYIEESPESILQAVENGEITMELIVRAVAIAQAAFMMTAVYTPYDEPEWVRETWKLRGAFSRIGESITRHVSTFTEDFVAKAKDDPLGLEDFLISHVGHHWTASRTGSMLVTVSSIGEHLAKSPQWQWESTKSPPSIFDLDSAPETDLLFVQDIDFALRRAEFLSGEGFGFEDIYQHKGQRVDLARYEPRLVSIYVEMFPLSATRWPFRTKWRRRYLASVISKHIDDSDWIPLVAYNWAALLEACLWQIRDLPSALSDHNPPSAEDLEGDLKRHPGITPDYSEYWAWEFGRLTATWPDRVYGHDDEGDADFFSQYESYAAAFSILDNGGSSVVQGYNAPTTIGAMVALRNREYVDPHADFRAIDFAPGNVNHLSHWIAKLGYQYARSTSGQGASPSSLAPLVNPSSNVIPSDLDIAPLSSDILILGDINRLARELAPSILRAAAMLAPETEQRLRQELTETIWGELSEDAKGYLFQAEQALEQAPNSAVLEYARTVECALEDWLPAPKGQQEWPGARVGEWCDVLKKMSRPEGRRHRLDSVARRHFDARHAQPLALRLIDLTRLRIRNAHPSNEPSRPRQVRKVVLGDADTSSIFELILRFAKRIRD